jgi:cobyrinic acid a,c-diamide synthase
MNTPTPRTDTAHWIRHPNDSSGERFVRDDFARTLEREIEELKKWKNEDPRMLREQIRVADEAFNELHQENLRLTKELAELKQNSPATK